MSLEKKSIHVRVAPELHVKLSVMSDFYDKDIAELGFLCGCGFFFPSRYDREHTGKKLGGEKW